MICLWTVYSDVNGMHNYSTASVVCEEGDLLSLTGAAGKSHWLSHCCVRNGALM